MGKNKIEFIKEIVSLKLDTHVCGITINKIVFQSDMLEYNISEDELIIKNIIDKTKLSISRINIVSAGIHKTDVNIRYKYLHQEDLNNYILDEIKTELEIYGTRF